MKRLLTIFLSFCAVWTVADAKVYTVSSPDGKTSVEISDTDGIRYSVTYNNKVVIAPSVIAMSLNGQPLDFKLKGAKTQSVKNTVVTPLYRQASVKECYNQTEIDLGMGWTLTFRAYDSEGVAYRFSSASLKKGDAITDETAQFNFIGDPLAFIPYSTGSDNPYATSFENRYTSIPLSAFDSEKIAFSPVLICLDSGVRVEITESDLESYPGMFLKKGVNNASLAGDFARIPSETKIVGKRGQEKVSAYSDRLAIVSETASRKNSHTFPWRAIAISDNDAGLPVNNLVWLLASGSRVNDLTWIKPGKVAWDWWNDWNISGVDFAAGINTQTYKYYIDFASANGIEYVVLDEGWSQPLDIMKVKPEINLKEIVKYAESKNVGIILWAVCYVLDKDLEKACKSYSKMGVKGFKIDFMDRDDQPVVDMLHRIAKCAAEHKMIVDYHGMYKPAGMNRTWPNVINFEGVWGLEQMKWSKDDMVEYDVTFPFIRMLAGPVDYTQGAMRNSLKSEFVPNYSNPSSQGTRARQVADYIIFDSPLVMLCDNPSAYMKEQETTDFIAAIPTVWDETRVLQAEIGKYIVTARRSGDKWYIGGLTNWDARDLTIDLKFLSKGTHNAVLYRDGVNAQRNATDYKVEKTTVQHNKSLTIHLASGGGFVIAID